jgi:hypothetical protein
MVEPITLEAVRKRDAESVPTWFKEPTLGACGRAFVDRRWCLGEIERLRKEVVALRAAIIGLVALTEGWAYGPLFKKAGVQWPNGVCQADALVHAKRMLGVQGDGTRPVYKVWRGELCEMDSGEILPDGWCLVRTIECEHEWETLDAGGGGSEFQPPDPTVEQCVLCGQRREGTR